MGLIKQPSAFLLSSVAQHLQIKNHLLDAIKKLGTHSLVENYTGGGQQLANTDWHLSPKFQRNYINLFSPIIEEHCRLLSIEFKLPFDLICQYFWFQQYATTDFHSWHVHHDCLYSSVYYLDLPEGASKTSFKFLDEEFEVDVKEGDILTFPGSVLHSSKPNKSKNIKTIIAFNTTIKTVQLKE
jgi:mannose-6-phosphate isomerase-like protein (cupin superfamily)